MNLANLSSPESNTVVVNKIKLLSFPIGKLNAALHIDVVQKVVNFATVYGSGLNHYGIATIEGEEITVIDLHKKFFLIPQVSLKERTRNIYSLPKIVQGKDSASLLLIPLVYMILPLRIYEHYPHPIVRLTLLK